SSSSRRRPRSTSSRSSGSTRRAARWIRPQSNDREASMRGNWHYLAAVGIAIAGCATMAGSQGVSDAEVVQTMKGSFKERGIAKLDRLEQSDTQKLCSEYATRPLPADVRARIEAAARKTVVLPADGKYLGDWKAGEKVA